MSTTSRRLAATVVAAATVTALTTAAAVPTPPPAPTRLVEAQVNLAASTGVYPIGPIPQAFRTLGMGTAQDFLNGMAGLAQIVPGEAGQGLKQTVENLAALVAALQSGVNLPILGNISIPEIAVPPMGPAGTVDQINTLQWSTLTQGTLSALKTALAAGDAAAVIIGLLGDITGIDTEIIETLVGDLPLNVPGTWDGPFFSDAGKFAIVPAIGLGGTNFALASPTLLNDPAFAKTAILAIALRNPSRTGGGILSLLDPLSSTVGLNLSNADGTASHKDTNNWGIPITVMDGNVTVWDFGAAYDIISDAPSTLLNPLAWFNSGVGQVAPTYLLPPNVDAFFEVISDLTGGNLSAGTINHLLDTADLMSLLHVDVGADGNLYVTYDSGRLPLLEPIQFIPRTLSYLPGFGFSTTLSDSFADVLTQLVAQGYQDVNMTVDAEGVATFTRGWDMAGTQAKFWQNPITWQMGLETPQTVFNSIITGLQTNLLDPDKGEFEIFGNKEIGNLVYRNAVSVAVAQLISQALEQVRDTLNPIINDVQGGLTPLAKALDEATGQVNKVIDDGLGAMTGLGVDLNGPMLDANRLVNEVGDGINNGIRSIFNLKPIDSPPALESTSDSAQHSPAVVSIGPMPGHIADHHVHGAVVGLHDIEEITPHQGVLPAGPGPGDDIDAGGVQQHRRRQQAAFQPGVLQCPHATGVQVDGDEFGALAFDGIQHRAAQRVGLHPALDQVVLGARGDRRNPEVFVGEAGQHNDRDGVVEPAQPVHGFHTGGIGQIQVEQDAVGTLISEGTGGVGDRLGPDEVELAGRIGDEFLDQQGIGPIVFYQEQRQAPAAGCCGNVGTGRRQGVLRRAHGIVTSSTWGFSPVAQYRVIDVNVYDLTQVPDLGCPSIDGYVA